ncbi:hypothetical protein E2C01_056432 [Portunus trituberculatus]|uniref:Uncharacterized protein n=1 Tax=Portunus trituberculatus TaxID=210409 RepID=A0A5B7GZL5_PORTR|nr:hypothetical protein [Portunus trituberculatus]
MGRAHNVSSVPLPMAPEESQRLCSKVTGTLHLFLVNILRVLTKHPNSVCHEVPLPCHPWGL